MSKLASIAGFAARVFELRETPLPWDAKGGVVETIQAEYPAAGVKNAIALRAIYKAEKAKRDASYRLPKTKKAVTAARKAGEGWDAIAGRSGLTVAEAKAPCAEDFAKGRVYVSADGSTNVKLEATTKKPEAKPELVYANDRG